MADTQTGLALFNAIATAGKTIYDIAQGTSKLKTKQQLMDVYFMNLKREAADLEDANRDLKEKVRFKSDDFEFRKPFWFDKNLPDRTLSEVFFKTDNRPSRGATMGSGASVCHATAQLKKSEASELITPPTTVEGFGADLLNEEEEPLDNSALRIRR